MPVKKEITLRDVLFLVHPTPKSKQQEIDFRDLAAGTLEPPDTWEVALSAGSDKKATWERLIVEKKLGGMAFIRNLRNMEQAGVDPKVIAEGFKTVNPGWLLPMNYMAAAKYAPKWERELEAMMLRGLSAMPKLPGYSIIVIDVSGSTSQMTSGKSEMSCMEAEIAMAMLAAEMCERVAVYITAGNDGACQHSTMVIKPRRGFALADQVKGERHKVGGGGIFTRQCLEYIKTQERETPDRIMVLSDSQDCDHRNAIPSPFGKHNYIINVAAHSRGVNYDGKWDAEVSGFSEGFIKYIAALEGVDMVEDQEQ